MENANSKDVLLVDDDPQFLELVAGFLETLGYKVAACKDGNEARKAFDERGNMFRFIVTDGYYSGGDSPALIRHVRTKNSEIPILLISGTLGGWLNENRKTTDFSRLFLRRKPTSFANLRKLFPIIDSLPPYRPKKRFSPLVKELKAA